MTMMTILMMVSRPTTKSQKVEMCMMGMRTTGTPRVTWDPVGMGVTENASRDWKMEIIMGINVWNGNKSVGMGMISHCMCCSQKTQCDSVSVIK